MNDDASVGMAAVAGDNRGATASNCRHVMLQNKQVAVPRSCPTCTLGPCKFGISAPRPPAPGPAKPEPLSLDPADVAAAGAQPLSALMGIHTPPSDPANNTQAANERPDHSPPGWPMAGVVMTPWDIIDAHCLDYYVGRAVEHALASARVSGGGNTNAARSELTAAIGFLQARLDRLPDT